MQTCVAHKMTLRQFNYKLVTTEEYIEEHKLARYPVFTNKKSKANRKRQIYGFLSIPFAFDKHLNNFTYAHTCLILNPSAKKSIQNHSAYMV